MKAFTLLVIASAVLLGSPGCRSKVSAPGYRGPVVFGAVMYRAPLNLPPDAMLTVRLLDVTRVDAPNIVLAEKSIFGPGQPPLAFELPYPPTAIRGDRRIVVEARIEVAGRPLFISATAHAVTPDTVMQPQEIWVERAR